MHDEPLNAMLLYERAVSLGLTRRNPTVRYKPPAVLTLSTIEYAYSSEYPLSIGWENTRRYTRVMKTKLTAITALVSLSLSVNIVVASCARLNTTCARSEGVFKRRTEFRTGRASVTEGLFRIIGGIVCTSFKYVIFKGR